MGTPVLLQHLLAGKGVGAAAQQLRRRVPELEHLQFSIDQQKELKGAEQVHTRGRLPGAAGASSADVGRPVDY